MCISVCLFVCAAIRNYFLSTISAALVVLLLQQLSNKVISVERGCSSHAACVCIHFKISTIGDTGDNAVIKLFGKHTKNSRE